MNINFKNWLKLLEDGTSAPNVSAAGGTYQANIGPPVPMKLFAGNIVKRKYPFDADEDEFTTCGLGGCPRGNVSKKTSKRKK